MNERRAEIRRKALKGARAAFNDGHSSVDCTLRNVSESGALLHFENVLGVPDEFTLVFDDGRPSCGCVVRLRRDKSLRVAFRTTAVLSQADTTGGPSTPIKMDVLPEHGSLRDYYCKQAEQCFRFAEMADDPAVRNEWIKLGNAWNVLAHAKT
jgi:hypothetical protein